MRLWNNPVLLLTISFCIGIVFGKYFIVTDLPIYVWIVSFSLFIFLYGRARFLWFQDSFFSIFALLVFIVLGMFCFQLHQPENTKNHYLNYEKNKANFRVVIEEKLNENHFFDNYIAEITQIDSVKSEGKILLSLENDTLPNYAKVGDEILLRDSLESIYSAKNPYQFSYKKFMMNRGIYRQITISPQRILKIDHQANFYTKAAKLKKTLEVSLSKNGFKPKEIHLMQALLLGNKNALANETYEKFTEAGVVHILAVSGLHIGILLGLLYYIFYPLRKFRFGKYFSAFIIISLLWSYAFLVGFTPSVLRAVTMFSCLSIGLLLKRRTGTLTMLCLSALILLLINPNLLFEVGFQLSYCAVLAIICFQPYFFRPFKHTHKIIRFFGNIASVTFAAQLGVFPLSIYYFHQFPGLFFLTNILVVPALGIILGLGLLIIFLSSVNFLPDLVREIYQFILHQLLFIINWVASQKAFLIEHIYFPVPYVIFGYALLITLFFTLRMKKKRLVVSLLILFISFQLYYIFSHQQEKENQSFTVFHISKGTLLGFQEQSTYKFYSDSIGKIKAPRIVENLENNIPLQKISTEDTLKNWYNFYGNSLLIIDQNGIFDLPSSASVDYVLLNDSPKINLVRVLNKLQPKKIIVDGSNYHSYVKRWSETCAQKKVPFHYTGKKGAFTLDY
ncbi:ComEC/Rec2 family competence protein [Mesonia maritima]|uniref:Competence protein ComEC n=1 Tax=Mesonia maritima TaxID=1793873 RepID=A0ABU1K2K6_9FLAO|nr:ComEC/Rec2 family competence protein [Mesonia maritima]MDR6299485.1 competence protein ComEC [Mesonia maritima]